MNWNIFYLSFIPAVLWIVYFYYQDKYEKEPLKILIATFLLGCFSIIPAVIIELIFQNFLNNAMYFSAIRILITMLVVGFAEEISKFLAVYVYSYKNPEFNEPMDGIVYCVTAAMGFAFVENIGYMLKFQAISGNLGAYSIGVFRALFSMFGHASFAVVLGSYVGRAKFNQKKQTAHFLKGITFAALIHTFYNFALQMNKQMLAGVMILLAFVLMWRNLNRVQMDRAADESPFKPEDETYKPKKWQWSAANLLSILLVLGVIGFEIIFFNRPITFKNSKMNYSVQHPSFWAKRINMDRTVVEFLGPRFRQNVPRARVEVIDITPGTDPNAFLLKTLDDYSKKDMKNLKKIQTRKVEIDGKPGILVKVRWEKHMKNDRTVPMYSYVVLSPHPPKMVRFRFDASRAHFDRFSDYFEDIMASFEFEKGKNGRGAE